MYFDSRDQVMRSRTTASSLVAKKKVSGSVEKLVPKHRSAVRRDMSIAKSISHASKLNSYKHVAPMALLNSHRRG